MILQGLPAGGPLFTGAVPVYPDHCLFAGEVAGAYHCAEHFTGLGIIAVLKGKGTFNVNGVGQRLDPDSFLVVNRGTRLSIRITERGTNVAMLFFNTLLSGMAASRIFRKQLAAESHDPATVHDFSLIEHIHYRHATLRNYLPLLISLGGSCASFHSLKADMLVRTLLDQLIHENFSAVQASANLAVVKKATRTGLYKRLSITKAWMEHHYALPVTIRQLADIAMLNEYHFIRAFKQAFHKTPHRHLTDVRLEQARHLLAATALPVSTICERVGFDSPSSFSWLFRQRLGISPSHYRQHPRETNGPA